MHRCPVCDFPKDDLHLLLARLDNPLLIALACDYASHVSDWAPNPAQTRG